MKKLILLTALMTLLFMFTVSAGVFTMIDADSILNNASVFINITSGINDTRNCTITFSSALQGVSYTRYAHSNTTGVNYSNTTVDSQPFVDASDYTISAICENSTIGSDIVTPLTSVIVDTTVPTCSFASTLISGGTYNPMQTWSITGINATLVHLRFGGNQWTSLDEVSDVFTTSKKVTEGLYTTQADSSDGRNTTLCTDLTNVRISADEKVKQIAMILQQAAGKKTGDDTPTKKIPLGYIGSAVILVGLYYLYKKK